ncbi:hypothetical protein AB1Y20_016654 [Prymnesium parvum]|uniref:Uncharacterized protein n=1 Tax=Prymnesium parvum TaxID=97485 RepID=A0AB34ICY4_PRYPA
MEVDSDSSCEPEVVTASSSSDEEEPLPPAPTGAWSTVVAGRGASQPTAASLRAALLPQDNSAPTPRRPFAFYVRAAPSAGGLPLCKVTLPASWSAASVGRLVELLARQRQLPSWDVRLRSPRGVLPNCLPLRAAVVRAETALLERGPAPALEVPPEGALRTSLWGWGRGVDGVIRTTPTRVPTALHTVRRISLGVEHALALTASGLVLSWGENGCGQLGNGNETPRASPAVVRALAPSAAAAIACGPRCSAAISASAELWTWGANQPANLPSRFHSSWANGFGKTECGTECVAVAFGEAHALLLTRGGAVWSFGYNDSLQLGWHDAVASPVLRNGFQKPRAPLEFRLSPLANETVPALAVACGANHSAALVEGGVVFAWGDNSSGQCGSGGATVPVPSVLHQLSSERVSTLRCFGGATLAITEKGHAYLLGGGARGKDADDDEGSSSGEEEGGDVPTGEAEAAAALPAGGEGVGGLHAVLGARRLLAEQIAAGEGCEDHALLVGRDGSLQAFGYNRYGQVAPADERLVVHAPTPVECSHFERQRIVCVAAGGGASMALCAVHDSLAARCCEVLRQQLEQGDAELCFRLISLAVACQTPGLAALSHACMDCFHRRRAEVESIARSHGVNVEAGLTGLEQMQQARQPPCERIPPAVANCNSIAEHDRRRSQVYGSHALHI